MLLAQELQLVRREVDDDQLAAGRHDPPGLAHRGGRVGQVVQHLVDHHQIGAGLGQAGVEDVAVAQLAAAEVGFGHMAARDVKHLLRQVQADGVFGAWGQERQHAPGA